VYLCFQKLKAFICSAYLSFLGVTPYSSILADFDVISIRLTFNLPPIVFAIYQTLPADAVAIVD